MEGVSFPYRADLGSKLLSAIAGERIIALYFIGSTLTSTIPGISIAGATPELTLYTPACDVEYLVLGRPASLDVVPVTPEGIPTPALITRAALRAADIPCLVVDCGSYVEPAVPHVALPSKRVGGRIDSGSALPYDTAAKLMSESELLARCLCSRGCTVVLGESIPGGTTTALGILAALGYEAWGKVSSAGPENPHRLKEAVVKEGLAKSGLASKGETDDPVEAVSAVGDPVHISLAGFLIGALSKGSHVILAGGTQMAAVLAIAKRAGAALEGRVAVATTRWVVEDLSSDIVGLIKEVAPEVPIVAAALNFSNSPFKGLKYYEEGYVKEGVGAGGTVAAALASGRASLPDIYKAIFSEYARLLELGALKQQI